LFDDFIRHIDGDIPAPEVFQSEYWKGGMPYVSLSHYPDFDGRGVPGIPDAVYRDGRFLKAKGEFFDSPLGKACWNALKADVDKAPDERVRISIGFLDWMHKHKSSGYEFVRKDLDDICPECMIELMKGTGNGKEYLRGQLVHLAMTRVPMNERTKMDMEEKSMTTRKEDAESIVGEELAEDLESKSNPEISKALVTKTEDETPNPLEAKVDALALGIEKLFSAVEKMVEIQLAKPKKKEEEVEDEEEDGEDKPKKKEEKAEFEPVVKAVVEMAAVLGQKMDILIAQSKPTAPDGTVRRSVHLTQDQMLEGQPKRVDPTKPMTPREAARHWAGIK